MIAEYGHRHDRDALGLLESRRHDREEWLTDRRPSGWGAGWMPGWFWPGRAAGLGPVCVWTWRTSAVTVSSVSSR